MLNQFKDQFANSADDLRRDLRRDRDTVLSFRKIQGYYYYLRTQCL